MTEKEYEGTPELIFYCEYNPDKLEDRLEIPFTNEYDINLKLSRDEETREIRINVDLQPKESNIPKDFFGKNILNVTAIAGKNGVGKTRILNNLRLIAQSEKYIFILLMFEKKLFFYYSQGCAYPPKYHVYKTDEKGKTINISEFYNFLAIKTIFLNGSDFSLAPIISLGIKPVFSQKIEEITDRFNYKYILEFMEWIPLIRNLTLVDKYKIHISFPFITDLEMYEKKNFKFIFNNIFIQNNRDEVTSSLVLFFYFLSFIKSNKVDEKNLEEQFKSVENKGNLDRVLVNYLKNIDNDLGEYLYGCIALVDKLDYQITKKVMIEYASSIEIISYITEDIRGLVSFLEEPYRCFDDAKRLVNYHIPLSKGENYLLMSLSLIASKLAQESSMVWKSVIVAIDEYESHLHIEWVRRYLSILLQFLNTKGQELKIKFQVIIATHSPMIISDLPSESTVLLEMGKEPRKAKHGFASNYYDIMSDSFFLDDTIGEFAKQKINQVIKRLNSLSNLLDKKEFRSKKVSNKFMQQSQLILGHVNPIIELIGDPFIKQQLDRMMMSIDERLKVSCQPESKKKLLEKQRAILEAQIRQIDQELDND